MLSGITRDGDALARTLETQPRLAYGTRIYDAVTRALVLLREAKLSSGSIVLLSDGADIGSLRSLDQAVAAAKEQQVRIFTVGLRSGAFDPAALRSLADRTGGSYAEAHSAAELSAIYEELGTQLAGQYLVRYRSAARPMSQVDVRMDVAGAGGASTAYVAPTPSLLAPYHRSPVSTFLLSGGSPLVISLVFGLLVCAILLMFVRRPKSTMVDRVESFSRESRSPRIQTAATAAAGGGDPEPIHQRLVGAARARSRDRPHDGVAAASRRALAPRRVPDRAGRAHVFGAASRCSSRSPVRSRLERS